MTTLFKLRVVPTPFRMVAECLMCGAPTTVEPGAVMATFTVDGETLGVACDLCLTADTQARLHRMREPGRAGR